MSKEKQEQVDLKGLLRFSKRFHINLGVSQAIIGFTLYYLGYDKGLNLFLSTYCSVYLFYLEECSLSTATINSLCLLRYCSIEHLPLGNS